jgi:hypothetical protein
LKYKELNSSNGSFRKEWFNELGEHHRVGGPAIIAYDENKLLHFEKFYINGYLHREDGPANIGYFPNGSVQLEQFFLNGIQQRLDGPAHIVYTQHGSINSEYFVISGRFIGPVSKITFWLLWDKLSDNQRNNPNILKLLSKYS